MNVPQPLTCPPSASTLMVCTQCTSWRKRHAWCLHSLFANLFFLTFCIFMAMVTVNNRQTMSCQDGKQLMLSPDMFGWPCHRPRNYCVCTLDATCRLKGAGFSSIRALFRSSALNVSALFCASQDTSDWLFVGSVCIYIYIYINI